MVVISIKTSVFLFFKYDGVFSHRRGANINNLRVLSGYRKRNHIKRSNGSVAVLQNVNLILHVLRNEK